MVSYVIVCILIDLMYYSSKNMFFCKSSGLYVIELCYIKICVSVGFINLIFKYILLIIRYFILLVIDFFINMFINFKKGKKIDLCICVNREFLFYFLKRILRLFELYINLVVLYM